MYLKLGFVTSRSALYIEFYKLYAWGIIYLKKNNKGFKSTSYLPDNCICCSFLERYRFHFTFKRDTSNGDSVKYSLERQMYSVFYRLEVNFLIWRDFMKVVELYKCISELP